MIKAMNVFDAAQLVYWFMKDHHGVKPFLYTGSDYCVGHFEIVGFPPEDVDDGWYIDSEYVTLDDGYLLAAMFDLSTEASEDPSEVVHMETTPAVNESTPEATQPIEVTRTYSNGMSDTLRIWLTPTEAADWIAKGVRLSELL